MKNKVLIIDDDEEFRNNLMEMMALYGYQPEMAVNGEEGLSKIDVFGPDLIICDINMPVLNGYQVIRQLRNHNVHNTIVFVFLSSHIPLSNDEITLINLANDYITKPISFVSLVRRLETVLG